ncbi:hypothetical protein [Pseudolysinimonas sp.]|uniref:hypothetical protein n=1 Tax=Pseudolysinimonas sp. TaxID=2680009 RepID=UPI0037836821
MADGKPVEDRRLVVLDVNIYLDVAQLVGEPFSWERFEELARDHASADLPHRVDAKIDSLRALACLVSGRMPDGISVEVWTSDHIDYLVASKAAMPVDAADERDRGLGWSAANAQALVDDLVGEVVYRSYGSSIGEVPIAFGTPPLSHEDGCVYATARDAGYDDAWYERHCITRDGGFLRANLTGLIDRSDPSTWVMKHRALSRIAAFRRLAAPPAPDGTE